MHRLAALLSVSFSLLLFAGSAAAAQVELAMRADRTAIGAGEQVRVQISVESEGADSPDIVLPDFDGFEVLQRHVQRPMQFSFSFGSRAVVQSSTIYTFVLSPLRTGTLRIEPATVRMGGREYTTQPLDIRVSPGTGSRGQPAQPSPGQPGQPSTPPSGAVPGEPQANPDAPAIDGARIDPVAFVRTVVDKADPYVGEQVTVTIYLYFRQRLQSPPTIESEPTLDGFWTHDLLGPTHTFQPHRQPVDGALYYVYVLRRFAAFPLRSGELTIGPLGLSIDTSSVFDLFGTRRNPIVRRTGTPETLQVKPLPEHPHPEGDVAVGQLSLSAELDRNQVVGGDAVTLTAMVSGEGNLRTVRLDTPVVEGADVLEPQVREQIEAPNDSLSGTREFRWLIVPKQKGTLTVPPLTLHTFDPERGGYELLQTQPLTLEVVGEAAAALPPAQPEQPVADAPSVDGAHRFGPIRTQSELHRARTSLSQRAFYPWALAAPPLLWLLLWGGSGLRRWLRERASAGPLRAQRHAESRLQAAVGAAQGEDAAAFHSNAEASVLAVLEAKLGEGMRGLTRGQLRTLLRARGMDDELVTQTIELLERSDYARFGSAAVDSAQLREQAGALEQLYRRLAAFQPRLSEDAA